LLNVVRGHLRMRNRGRGYQQLRGMSEVPSFLLTLLWRARPRFAVPRSAGAGSLALD